MYSPKLRINFISGSIIEHKDAMFVGNKGKIGYMIKLVGNCSILDVLMDFIFVNRGFMKRKNLIRINSSVKGVTWFSIPIMFLKYGLTDFTSI